RLNHLTHVPPMPTLQSFFFHAYHHPRDLHSFPTRRSSDLPPKKRMVARHDTVIMLAYSPIKNIANLKLAYSVWKPATSSPSASGKSKGKRLVSAIAAVKK